MYVTDGTWRSTKRLELVVRVPSVTYFDGTIAILAGKEESNEDLEGLGPEAFGEDFVTPSERNRLLRHTEAYKQLNADDRAIAREALDDYGRKAFFKVVNLEDDMDAHIRGIIAMRKKREEAAKKPRVDKGKDIESGYRRHAPREGPEPRQAPESARQPPKPPAPQTVRNAVTPIP